MSWRHCSCFWSAVVHMQPNSITRIYFFIWANATYAADTGSYCEHESDKTRYKYGLEYP